MAQKILYRKKTGYTFVNKRPFKLLKRPCERGFEPGKQLSSYDKVVYLCSMRCETTFKKAESCEQKNEIVATPLKAF